MSITVASGIQPDPSLMLTIARRHQQTIHGTFICFGGLVSQEDIDV